jgi:hypothetical protein
MSRGERKRERARLVEARRESERAAFLEAVPFTREELVEWLGQLSRLDPAPEPFGHTRRWAEDRGFDWGAIAQAFAGWEIASDRDVLMEAKPYAWFGPTPGRLAWMPLERAQLEALLEDLDDLGDEGCDHTQRQAARWLAERGLPVPETLAALRAQAAFCDCELDNVEPEFIYPPSLQTVIDPPPPKSGTVAPRSDVYRDAALVLPLPRKPWRQCPVEGRPQARLILQFGQGSGKPELRVLVVERPRDETAWCLQRWRAMNVEEYQMLPGTSDAHAERTVSHRWQTQGRTIVGPAEAAYGGVTGRWYLSKGTANPIDAGWCLLDLPGGFRVIELDVVAALTSWDPFHREARKVLAALALP